MNTWIQKSDYSSTELETNNVNEIIEIFKNYNWLNELNKRDDSDNDCDPGLGITQSDDSVLHICPIDDKHYYVTYLYSKTKKIFGLFSMNSNEEHYLEKVDSNQAIELIKLHYNNNRNEILKH
jgi:hypothetical protein